MHASLGQHKLGDPVSVFVPPDKISLRGPAWDCDKKFEDCLHIGPDAWFRQWTLMMLPFDRNPRLAASTSIRSLAGLRSTPAWQRARLVHQFLPGRTCRLQAMAPSRYFLGGNDCNLKNSRAQFPGRREVPTLGLLMVVKKHYIDHTTIKNWSSCDRCNFWKRGQLPGCAPGRNEGARGEQFPGRRMIAGVPETSQYCHKYFLQDSTFASKKPQVRTWGRQTCFLPRAPSSLVTPLCASLPGCGPPFLVAGGGGLKKPTRNSCLRNDGLQR